MTKVSHGPEHYREHRIRASETGLIVKHYRILPEDKEAVDELVRPYKEKGDAHFRRVRREQRVAEKKREAEERSLAKNATLPPSLEKPSESGKPSMRVNKPVEEPEHLTDQISARESRNTLHQLPKRRPMLTLNFRKAS
jgi:hypothetical protein